MNMNQWSQQASLQYQHKKNKVRTQTQKWVVIVVMKEEEEEEVLILKVLIWSKDEIRKDYTMLGEEGKKHCCTFLYPLVHRKILSISWVSKQQVSEWFSRENLSYSMTAIHLFF